MYVYSVRTKNAAKYNRGRGTGIATFLKMTTPEMQPELNLDTTTWEGWLNSLILWTAQNPLEFLYYVLLGLSPFVVMSLLLSWKLAKMLEKENKKKAKRENSVMKAKKAKIEKKD